MHTYTSNTSNTQLQAGGRVTDLNGDPLNFSPSTVEGVGGLEGARLTKSMQGVIATNDAPPHFHQSVVSALQSLSKTRSSSDM
jgi:hypothetical protein